MAKLFVPFGAPDHSSAGDTLPPEQPQPLPLYSCSSAIFAPALMSGLLRANAFAALAPASAATANAVKVAIQRMGLSPPMSQSLVALGTWRYSAPDGGDASRGNRRRLIAFGFGQPLPMSAGLPALHLRTFSAMRAPTPASMLLQYSKARLRTGSRTPPSRLP